jgi:hypothetical protein
MSLIREIYVYTVDVAYVITLGQAKSDNIIGMKTFQLFLFSSL